MFVLPSYRRRGIGRELMTAALEEARRLLELRKIHLRVSMGQPSARKLYAALGFRMYGVEPEALNSEGCYFDEDHMFLDVADGA
jgi:GNAT superfamily N-acetyltransferase